MDMETIIFGDPHCDFSALEDAARDMDPDNPPLCIFVGDFGFADRDTSNWEQEARRDSLPLKEHRSPDEILRPLTELGCRILHVRGNHDFDDPHQYEAVANCRALMDGNLHGRVVEVGGVRIAGLEGVFGGPWQPKSGNLVSPTREHWLANNRAYKNGNRWHPSSDKKRGIPPGLQVRHRQFIFPEDYEHMRGLRADVLVTHEAPVSDGIEDGVQAINDLASEMGVRMIVHGHTHVAYSSQTVEGIEVHCAPIHSTLRMDLACLRPDGGYRP